MKDASLTGTSAWAISATAVALVLAGVLIGQQLEQPAEKAASTVATTEPGAVPAVDAYRVPDWLDGAPLEWRSEVTDEATGTAILLDYHRRELLVDQCVHPGFFDLEKNLPKENTGLNCTRVLTSSIVNFGADGADVRTPSGEDVFVALKPVMDNNVGKLEIDIDHKRIRLVPGQTNDLNQALIRGPRLAREREALQQFKLQEQLQQRAQMAAVKDQGVPRFALPASVLEQQEKQRAQDALEDQAREKAER